ncbi:MAG: hypothetical protein H7Y08_10370, partial [Rhizobiaceae bacterium]|nr:hypothetical protein [Rhizobiaceae bacterium]
MVQRNTALRHDAKDAANASLAALSRTLEALETRLSKLTPAAVPAASAPPLFSPAEQARPAPLARAPEHDPAAVPGRHRPSLSDAVSEIVLRRQMLDEAPRPVATVALAAPVQQASFPAAPRAHSKPSMPREEAFAPREDRPSREERLDKRFQALAGDVDALRAEGNNFALMAEVAEELQRLRHELRPDGSRSDPRFESMREAFESLRRMIETRQSADAIGAEMADISGKLARLTEEGADRATLNTLRAELEEMRSLFADVAEDMAKEKTVVAVGRRWDAFENRLTQQAETDTQSRTDIKNELERLRESLRSLASEDHVRAVEKRWDDFEDRYLGTAAMPSEDTISKLLREELETMREKLEGMSQSAPMLAVDERWDALEERLDSRQVEASIQRLAERMGEIEATLASFPATLGIAPLEERMRALGASVDSLAQRELAGDLDHFIVLEERLDEISRAIVAASLQAPAFDMGPIERIEARIAALTSRVDRFADEADAEALSLRIAELSDRVEDIANGGLTEELNRRVAGLAERLETVFAEIERPGIDTAVIEERLAALALRLEDAGQPRIDTDMMRSLEAQIARLSESLAQAGSLSSDEFDHDFDRRLALVEQRLDENRDALIAAARQAAEETAVRMEAAGERRQGEHVAQLSENLRSLEQLSRETDDRSSQVFDAVHTTLLKIVDRLELIEVEISKGGERVVTVARDAVHADRAAAHMAAA